MKATLTTTVIQCPRPPHKRQIRCLANKQRNEELVDYYDLLEVSPDAPGSEIKRNFRRLQKQYHPDISGHEATSSVLNQAYNTLMDSELRSCYDRKLATVPLSQRVLKQNSRDQPGIVGPLADAELVMKRTISDLDDDIDACMSESVIWLREWAKTFMFAADLPLPLPLQCDDVDSGVRLAFITATKDRVRSAGELHFVISMEGDKASDKEQLYLSVYRIVPATSCGMIPGEHEVVKAFKNALRDKYEVTHQKHAFFGFELTGLVASAAAQFMPAFIGIPVEKVRGSSYEAYHLRHPANHQSK